MIAKQISATRVPRRFGPLAALLAGLLFAASTALAQTAPKAPSGEPIRIGLSMALTGSLAVNGKSGLLAMQIWAEDTNAKGGLLGRPVKLVFYDDQTNSSLVPGIYTKLLDVDKVDLVVSGYGTNIAAPAMPVVIQHKATFISLFALDINEEFKYPKYFSMLPVGPDPRPAISEGFFEIIKAKQGKARAEDDRAGDRRRRGDAQRHRWRAGEPEKGRARCRLRQELPTGDDRFHPDHPRHSGNQRRRRFNLILSE